MAQELYNLIPDALSILSGSYTKIGQLGVAVVDQENSPRQQATINQLVAATRLYRTIMRHVILNDAATAIIGLDHIEVEIINDLLENLKKTAALLPVPVYPTPLTTYQFNFGNAGSGFDLVAGQLGDLIVHNGSNWVNFGMGPEGYNLVSTSTGLQWSSQVGNGIPAGGSANQFLKKNSGTSFDVVWDNISISDVTDITSSATELNSLDGLSGSVAATQFNQLVGINTSQTIQQQLDGKLSGNLPDGQFWVGLAGIPTPRTPTGDVVFNNTGVFSYSPLSIDDADISTTAAIARTKIASGSTYRLIINNATGVMDEAAAITPSRALVSDLNGIPVASTVSATELGYSSGVTSSIQTQLNSKLTVSLSSLTQGDMLFYNGTNWVNLALGTTGQVLQSNGTTVVWGSAAGNALPAGGSAQQYLRKIDGTDYNTEWHTLVIDDVTDISATAAEINILSGVDTANINATQINYLAGVNAPLQPQIDNKLSKSLAYNAIWVGNASNEASQYPAGNDGEVLTIVGSAPQWQPFPLIGDAVNGPGAGTDDNAVVRWNGTTGLSIQNSVVIMDDSGNTSGLLSIRTTTTDANTFTIQGYDVDGTTYVTFATLTAGNTPTFDLSDDVTKAGSYIYRAGGTPVALADGGTGVTLADPDYDAVMVWDDTLNEMRLAVISGMTYDSGLNTLTATGGGGGGHVIEYAGTPLTDRSNLNFYNGLTALDNDPNSEVILGGPLSTNTTITGVSGTYNFNITELVSGSFVSSTGYGILIDADSATLGNSSDVYVEVNATGISITDATRLIGFASGGMTLNLGADATGDIYYRDAGGFYTRRAAGTEGYVLTMSSGLPVWAAATATYTDGDAQAAVGAILTDSATIDFTYNGGGPSITASVIDNSITTTKMAQLAGLSVLGRSASSTGNMAAITSTTDGHVLQQSSSALSFGLLSGANFSTQTASTFFAGPISGSAAIATFRGLATTDLPFPSRTEPGTTYTLQPEDHGYAIYFTSPTGTTVTVPSTLSTDFWVEAVRSSSAGIVTFVAGGTSVLNTIGGSLSLEYANAGSVWQYIGANQWYGAGAFGLASGGGGAGTVTSVNNSSITSFATATGGPITGSGTLGYTLDSQTANYAFLAPVSSTGTPSFRAIDMLDLPRPARDIPDASYTIVDADLGYNLYFTNPTGASVNLTTSITVSNFWVVCYRSKLMISGNLSFIAFGSAALNTVNGETDITWTNGSVLWEYKGSNDWYGAGALGTGSSGSGTGHIIENNGSALTTRANLNFSNGLTASDNNPDTDVKLGGALTAATAITGNYDFSVTGTSAFSFTTATSATVSGSGASTLMQHGSSVVSISSANVITLSSNTGTSMSFAPAGTTLTLGADATGDMYYRNGSGFLTRLAAGAATTVIGSSGSVPVNKAVSNGLTSDASTLKLGGALTAETTINGEFGLILDIPYVTFKASTENTGTTVFQFQDSSSSNLLRLTDQGGLVFGGSYNKRIYNAAAGALTGAPTIDNDGRQMVFGTQAGSSGATGPLFTFHGGTMSSSGSIEETLLNLNYIPLTSTGALSVTGLSINPQYTLTGTANGTMRGIDYNPTGTYANTTHYGLTIGAGASGFGTRTPTALLHVAAGTTTLAPVKLTTGTALTTPADGSLEYHASHLYFTIGSTRYQLDQQGGAGSVTSVAATAPASGFTISGSPITGSGTFVFALNNDLASLENLGSTGIAVRSGTNTWVQRSVAAGTGIAVTNGNGVSGNPTVALSHLGIQNLADPNADRIMFWDDGAGTTEWLTIGSGLTITGTTLDATGGGSGTVTSIATAAPAAGFTISGGPITTAGTFTFALADDLAALEGMAGTGLVARTASNTYAQRTVTAGTGIGVSNGSGVSGNPTVSLSHLGLEALTDPGADRILFWDDSSNVVTWLTVGTGLSITSTTLSASVGSGTVTSVAATAPAAGFTVSGSPITGSGTFVFALADDLAGLEGMSGTGLVTRTASNTYTQRTVTAGTGIGVTNGSGVSGNPTVSLSHLGIQSLTDPNADRILFWDDSGGATAWLTLGTGLSITTTTINGNVGTVTSVAATAPAAGFTVSGSPITSSGTFTFALANDLAALEGLASTGIAVRSASDTWVQRSVAAGTGISVSNGNGVSGNPTVSLSHLGIQSLTDPNADRILFWDDSGGATAWLTLGTGLSISSTTINGLSNAAAANEMAKSNGTNLIASGVFSTTDGNLILGSASLAGTNRTITASTSGASANISLVSAGTGGVAMYTNALLRSFIDVNGAYQWGGSAGTAGQALISNGASAPPTWQDLPSSGTYTPTWTAPPATSGVSSVSFSTAMWTRIDDTITVSVYCSMTFSITGSRSFYISVPIAGTTNAAGVVTVKNNPETSGLIFFSSGEVLVSVEVGQASVAMGGGIVFTYTI